MLNATLGRSGLSVSRLGFGCMRLPMRNEKEVDRDKAIPMLRRAVELGVSYFDTAIGYCGTDSQRVLGEAMEGLRDRVVLSTKNHFYDKTDRKHWRRQLEDSLRFLRTDRIDLYNFHGLNFENFQRSVDGEDGLYREMLAAKEQGLVRHIGHSFHGSLESLKRCVDTGLFEVVTLQYNLLDQSLAEGIGYAAAAGMGVVIMGLVGGGRLGTVTEQLSSLGGKSTPEIALRFVLSHPGVTLALSGMSTVEQLEENAATVSSLGPFTAEDRRAVEDAIQERKKLAGLYCTGCNYCMPCPDGVDIPGNFTVYNLSRVFGLTVNAKARYASLGGQAALCRQCGKCVPLCPQNLDIPTRLSETVTALDARAGTVHASAEARGATLDPDGAARLSVRWHVKNYTDAACQVEAELHAHGVETVDPPRIALEAVKPFGRRHRDVELRVPAQAALVALGFRLRAGGRESMEHVSLPVAFATREGRAARVTGAAPAAFDFSCAWDREALTVRLETENAILCPAKDGFRVFLDAREPALLGRAGYAEQVAHVTVAPAREGGAAAVLSNGKQAACTAEQDPAGWRITLRIPWDSVSRAGSVPTVCGFDVAWMGHDAEGVPGARASWTGRGGQERDPAAFGRLFLI